MSGGSGARPRVLMVCAQFGPGRPLTGGAERQAEKLALALRARGIAVEFATPAEDSSWPRRYTARGLTVHTFALSDLTRLLLRGAGIPNLLLREVQTRRALRALLPRFDLVHGHIASPFTPAVAAEAARLGIPVVWKVASGGETFDLRTLAATTLLGPRLVQRALAGVDRWIAISGQIAGELANRGVPSDRIVRIPNGVDVSAAPPLASGGVARRFLYLGRLTPDREFGTLLQAFEAVASRVPDAEFALVGSGPLEEEVRGALARLSRAAARTRMVGHSPPAPWLEWADVLVLPSRSEGMSNALLEAMAAGRACVATDVPPNREVLDGGRLGLLTRAGEAEAMAGALLRLAAVPGEAARLGHAARRRVAEVYDVGRVADRYMELYGEMLRGGNSGVQAVEERAAWREVTDAEGAPFGQADDAASPGRLR